MKDAGSEKQLHDFELVMEQVHARLNPVAKIYRQTLVSIWIGNGGASIATLAFIGTSWKNIAFLHSILFPLTFFVLGLVSMGVGSALYLYKEYKIIHRMEYVNNILDFRAGEALSPTERVGLSFKDLRTWSAIISALCFVIGCIIGLIELWFARGIE